MARRESGMSSEPIAHSENSDGTTQSLFSHLLNVSEAAARFGAKFDAEILGRMLGLCHDIGKFHPEFQDYITGGRLKGVDHKLAGALIMRKYWPDLALIIDGHHGGLPCRGEFKSNKLLDQQRILTAERALQVALPAMPELEGLVVEAPLWLRSLEQSEFFYRMLFSALVDADFLDTEHHFYPERREEREHSYPLSRLWEDFERFQQSIRCGPPSVLNTIRDEIYSCCVDASAMEPGIFRLTVPTGGGKTLSGMGFALKHALTHGMDRVIFAIPFTSIVEQTANVYRRMFGETVVLEHHSAVELPDSGSGEKGRVEWQRLASENWDAQVIVTTNVQLFESLFASKPSRCRKLHNIARSVIVLDEVQTLPPRLLEPILGVLRELVANYHVTVVLCSATQPAFENTEFLRGFDDVTEIVPAPDRYFQTLKRVNYQFLAEQKVSWNQVAERMRQSRRALTIVNTKGDAITLMRELDDPDALHLSTLLCGAHRRFVMGKIRARLANAAPCSVVSTQVVESGVDFDFPLVLRALGPLDRIVQAAGRCNREAKLPDLGNVVIFHPSQGKTPPGWYASATDLTNRLLNEPGFSLDNPDNYSRYFGELWQQIEVSGREIQQAREVLDYPRVAEKFRMIDDDTVPVVVHYPGKGRRAKCVDELVEQLRAGTRNPRSLIRKLQPYIVNLRSYTIEGLLSKGLLCSVIPGLWEWLGPYDRVLGLSFEQRDPADYVV